MKRERIITVATQKEGPEEAQLASRFVGGFRRLWVVSAVLFNSLQHGLVLHRVAPNSPVKVRRELDGTLTRIIDGGKSVDKRAKEFE